MGLVGVDDVDEEAAGRAWHNPYDLVFTTDVGTPLDTSNVRRVYSLLAKKAEFAHVHPHTLRHAAASLLSAAGVPIEDIADTLGHRSTTVTAEIYRHPIAPVRSGHMTAMNQLIKPTPDIKPNGEQTPRNPDRVCCTGGVAAGGAVPTGTPSAAASNGGTHHE